MSKSSYAENLRRSLAALPVKKKCCVHALHDAESLYTGISAEERAESMRSYAERAKCAACVSHFVRALFCRCGSVTDPEKRYHLDLSFETEAESRALAELLKEQGISGGCTERKGKYIFYLKDGEAIADFLAYIGANTAAFDFMNSRITREFRNNVNRQVNCDTANIEKALQASQKQIALIRRLRQSSAWGMLPDSLRETAELRLSHEQMSLKELGDAHNPSITKSGVNHRLAKIVAFAKTQGID